MSKTDKKVRTSKRNFILALALLLLTNILMGVTLMSMAKNSLREQIEQRMLDIAKTAAYQLDGDIMRELSASDKGSEEYRMEMAVLRSFQENIDLDYIYAIRQENDGSFTFTIDPDTEQPGEFGAAVVETKAMKAAAAGTASVDKSAHADWWGRFYSAYCPVYDSQHRVAGIVGVDFNADWYDGKLNDHRAVSVILTMAALTIGIVLSFVIMSHNRKRFAAMLESIAELDRQTQKLDNIILESSVKKMDMLPDSESEILRTLAAAESDKPAPCDEYDELNTSIRAVYDKLNKYIRFIDSEIYTDDTTGVKNKAAYKIRIKELDEKIAAGTADFSVAFFDINGIKHIYTNYGYEAGDKLMYECSRILKNIYGKKNIYHIIGDEFIVLYEGKSRSDMENLFSVFEEEIDKYNSTSQGNSLSVAKGSATFDKFRYKDYRQVFIDAKARCDKDKANHYEKK